MISFSYNTKLNSINMFSAVVGFERAHTDNVSLFVSMSEKRKNQLSQSKAITVSEIQSSQTNLIKRAERR